MPSFVVVPHPLFSPTRCVTCGSNHCRDGFVDLLVDSAALGFDEAGDPLNDPAGVLPTIGHLYQCLTCLFQAANAAGCLDPEQRAEWAAQASAMGVRLSELERELEAERENKVVALADVKELLRQRGGRPPKTVEATG